MKDRKEHLRSEVNQLGDISPEIFREQLHRLADWIADYRENISQLRIAPNDPPGAVLERLPKNAPETGTSLDEIFADLDRVIVPGLAHWAHPQFMSYFGCTTTSPGILAEMVLGALNVNAMTWRTSPAATELETLVLDWLRQWLGLPEKFSGVVYDTASISTMHALATAREEAVPQTRQLGLSGRDLPPLRIYASDQAHSSVEKGAIAIGIGKENVVRVPTDADFRMKVTALREMVASDRRHQLKPMAVVATVGTTSTTSVDPVADIAKVCREEKMWLHIDGAYGAGLALLPECKWVAEGWSEADSIVINPHKMLFVPFDFSALYVRDLERVRRLFTLAPEHLHLRDPVGAEINYMDYGVQLGRRFRALKAWVVWRTFGREGLAARIRDHLRLARLLADWIKIDKRFELTAPVVMGVVCFRFIAAENDQLDMLNSKIIERINASGRAYLTRTKLNGRTVMRVGLGNILTTEEHLRNVWGMIQEAADKL
jgi:aromatic-L-amino-acid decarboxylase